MRVQILVADRDWLDNDDDKEKAEKAERNLKKLSAKYTDNFEYAHYKHIPTHSIVMVDDECIVGPIFPDVNSRYTPAIHLKQDSQFAKHYVEYFDSEWNKWSKDKEELKD